MILGFKNIDIQTPVDEEMIDLSCFAIIENKLQIVQDDYILVSLKVKIEVVGRLVLAPLTLFQIT